MKQLFTFLILLFTIHLYAQQTINGSITHDGMQRTYILYIPATYSPTNPAPLVFNLHGYTSNANDQLLYGEFRPIADTAGFILVVPQGTTDGFGIPYWNAGWQGNTDDVGFVSALIDSLSASYNINTERVYSTGMSNGGYMSYYLACNLSTKIAAIASVTGAMTKGTPATCNPQHPTPILEIHGDADATVPYNGNTLSESVQSELAYWTTYNNTDTAPSITTLPDINTTDNSTVEHHLYANGNNCVEVEHYKILNGGHTWPGAPVNTGSGNTNHDINASLLIWEFFLKYDINGKIDCASTDISAFEETAYRVNIYPNPATNFFKLTWEGNKEVIQVVISNVLGEQILIKNIMNQNETSISTHQLEKGLYFVSLLDEEQLLTTKKIVVE